jgi:hypothetical protein
VLNNLKKKNPNKYPFNIVAGNKREVGGFYESKRLLFASQTQENCTQHAQVSHPPYATFVLAYLSFTRMEEKASNYIHIQVKFTNWILN